MEITFLIKAFFFVYLGLTVELSLEYSLVALGIVTLMLCVRYMVASGVGSLLNFTVGERVLSRVIYLQGTSALVLSELPGLLDPMGQHLDLDIYKNFAYPIVFLTIIFVSSVGPTLAKRQLRTM